MFLQYLLTLCFLFIISQTIHIEKVITEDYILMENGFYVRIKDEYFGVNSYKINQQTENTYINGYKSSTLKIIRTDSIQMKNNLYQRHMISNTLTLGYSWVNATIFMYNFPIQSDSNTLYQGISFSFSPDNTSFSFIHQLKKGGKIDRLFYGFSPLTSVTGYFFIGGLPYISRNLNNKIECDVLSKNWGCELTSVFFSNKNQNNKILEFKTKPMKVIFQAAYKDIYAPKKFIELVKNYYFKTFFEEKICYEKKYNSLNIKGFECKGDKKIFNILPDNINFAFNNKLIQLSIKNITQYYPNANGSGYFKFNIYESLLEKENNIWIFGASFLQNTISSFDYDNKKITFYSSRPFLSLNDFSSDNSLLMTYIYCCNSLIMLFFIIILILNLIKLKL